MSDPNSSLCFLQNFEEHIPSIRMGKPNRLSGGVIGTLFLAKEFLEKPDAQLEIEAACSILMDLEEDSVGSLWSGLPGLLWAIDKLCVNDRLYDRLKTKVCNLDARLTDEIRAGSLNDTELIRGLAGLLVYACDRGAKISNIALVEVIFDALFAKASWEGDACYWPFHPAAPLLELTVDSVVVDLGMAHGVPGCLSALARFSNVIPNRQQNELLIKGAVAWISRSVRDPVTGSYFARNSYSKDMSLLGWCYGDISVAISLMHASISLRSTEIRELCRTISVHAAQRYLNSRTDEPPGMCHGSAGVGKIFYNINKVLNENLLDKAVQLALKRAGLHCSNFASFASKHDEQGLLSGVSGAALALASIKQNKSGDWETPFLFNFDYADTLLPLR